MHGTSGRIQATFPWAATVGGCNLLDSGPDYIYGGASLCGDN